MVQYSFVSCGKHFVTKPNIHNNFVLILHLKVCLTHRLACTSVAFWKGESEGIGMERRERKGNIMDCNCEREVDIVRKGGGL
jgi:hypothetical protein